MPTPLPPKGRVLQTPAFADSLSTQMPCSFIDRRTACQRFCRREDLNFRPPPYQRGTLTRLSYPCINGWLNSHEGGTSKLMSFSVPPPPGVPSYSTEVTGLEPAIPAVTGRCLNQLGHTSLFLSNKVSNNHRNWNTNNKCAKNYAQI